MLRHDISLCRVNSTASETLQRIFCSWHPPCVKSGPGQFLPFVFNNHVCTYKMRLAHTSCGVQSSSPICCQCSVCLN